MLVLMCGLPSCGKSAVVDIISEKSGSTVWVVRPSDWLPDNIDQLDPEEEKNYRIECWRTAISNTEEAVEKCDPSDAVILDCGNSKFRPLNGLLRTAKRNGHKLFVLYVNSSAVQCEARAGKQFVPAKVVKSYIESIRDSLPKFKSKCDRIIVVENTDTLDVLEQNALTAWSKLCQIT